MTDFASSHDHLLAELECLDLRLRAMVGASRAAFAEDPQLRGLWISEAEVDALLREPTGVPGWVRTPPALDGAAAALRTRIDARVQASLPRGIDLRLPRLCRAFGLGDDAAQVLLLCLACAIEPRYERLCAYLQDDVSKKRPSVGLALALLGDTLHAQLRLRSLFAPHAPLLRHRLVDLLDDPGQPQAPLRARALQLPERVAAYLLGDDTPADALADCTTVQQPAAGIEALVLGAEQADALQALAARAQREPALVVQLLGPAGAGLHEAATALCHALDRPLLAIDLARLGDHLPERWPLVAREALLQGAVPCLLGFDRLLTPPQAAPLACVTRWLQEHGGVAILAGAQRWQPAGETRGLAYACLRLPLPDATQRQQLWRSALDALPGPVAEQASAALAPKFRFGPAQIRDAAASGIENLMAEGGNALAQLHQACRLHSSQRLGLVARKITPHHRWDDIVLPADRLALLRDICNHVKYRGQVYGSWGFDRKLAMGKGLAVLFAGPSGTGKTMAADIIAGELGLDLFKIDLASVISKFIGETEKNLAALFDEAESSNAILFFDEADALFGKRSEVRDSHDRYANVEVGYLLQRIEAYEGVAILATNFRKNMDEAFVRRLHFTVDFPFPTPADRRSIWAGIWPQETPCAAGIDAGDLGRRFELTGGNIRNVALGAAFLAADDGGQVRLEHVLRATQREFQKMGKLIDDKAFAGALP
ncbi:ATP-binding protein [Pseudorhodoferax sp.]|uniref:ATP-binding protein n=1 Tax=Pseudorhodoferax sp. TaxID=1993553 RepID=UPI002DD66D2A|nr:AAA family ATPase [Pseudorhodoferax sp.]